MKQPMSLARRRLLQFLVSVVALHGVAIAIYYAADVAHATARRQQVFAWLWIGLTVAVIGVGLRRIKQARRAR